ncbi:hypothetical protein FRB90_001337 [Tulasnella sp. 427]|nr:hypothetical protein FRB90_001337 [Tulasnella sp. 427]
MDTFSIITNKDIIEVNQDALGVPAKRVITLENGVHEGTIQIWLGPLVEDDMILAALNASPHNHTFPLSIADLGLPHNSYTAQDLWAKQEGGGYTRLIQRSDTMTINLRSHQSKVWRLRPGNFAFLVQQRIEQW